jgi:hypothetical protein
MTNYFEVHEGFRRNLIHLEKTKLYISNVIYNGLLPYRNFSLFEWKNGVFFYKKTDHIEIWANAYNRGHISLIVSFKNEYFKEHIPTSRRLVCLDYICPNDDEHIIDEYFNEIVNRLENEDMFFQYSDIYGSELISRGHFSYLTETDNTVVDLSIDIYDYSKFVGIINDLFLIKHYIDNE